MRYTAIITVLVGIVIGCFAAYHYASGGPSGQAESPPVAGLVVPLIFAAGLVIAGVVMWFVGGRGVVVSGLASDGRATSNQFPE